MKQLLCQPWKHISNDGHDCWYLYAQKSGNCVGCVSYHKEGRFLVVMAEDETGTPFNDGDEEAPTLEEAQHMTEQLLNAKIVPERLRPFI